MTAEQLETLNLAVAELVRTYREHKAYICTEKITQRLLDLIEFEENYPLAAILQDLEFYVDEAGLLG